jgi:hypothetical protein
VSEKQKQQVREWGEIHVGFYLVDSVEVVSSVDNMPKFEFEEFGTLSEKAVYKTRPGDAPDQFAGLSAPEQTNGLISQVRTIGDCPFASFVFKYRSKSKFLTLSSSTSIADNTCFSREPSRSRHHPAYSNPNATSLPDAAIRPRS